MTDEPTAIDFMRGFWMFNPHKPLWAMVSVGGEQPVGYIKSWSMSKREMARLIKRQWHPENWKLVCMRSDGSVKGRPHRRAVLQAAHRVGQRVVSQSAGGYALERQGFRFFVVRESDRNEAEVSAEHVGRTVALIIWGRDLGDLLRGLWQSVKYDPREFEP